MNVENGDVITSNYDVIRYGVKRDKSDSKPYYQGFGKAHGYPDKPEEDVDYILGPLTVNNHYKRGYFPIAGPYYLHSGNENIRSLPSANSEGKYDTGGRRNYGCMAVIAKWEDLRSQLEMVPVGSLILTVQPFETPSTPPIGTPVK